MKALHSLAAILPASILARRIAFLLLLLGAGLMLVQPSAAAPFQWEQTGSLATARLNHTATLLHNGKVLVAGGFTGVASAELYDPATGIWTTTGSHAVGRYYHTATLLPNGKVLVVGGEGKRGFLTATDLYDPATGTWSATGELSEARVYHTATLLNNGQVLVAGGFASDYTGVLASRELTIRRATLGSGLSI